MPTTTTPTHLIPDAAVDHVCDAFDGDRVDDEQADAIRDALNRWYDRRRPPPPTRRTGTVNRWHAGEPFGFLTEDGTRDPWFISAGALPPGTGRLEKGTRVAFLGDPERKVGRRYPHAVRVEVIAAGGEAAR